MGKGRGGEKEGEGEGEREREGERKKGRGRGRKRGRGRGKGKGEGRGGEEVSVNPPSSEHRQGNGFSVPSVNTSPCLLHWGMKPHQQQLVFTSFRFLGPIASLGSWTSEMQRALERLHSRETRVALHCSLPEWKWRAISVKGSALGVPGICRTHLQAFVFFELCSQRQWWGSMCVCWEKLVTWWFLRPGCYVTISVPQPVSSLVPLLYCLLLPLHPVQS